MEGEYCRICGRNNAELHHILFKSNSKSMRDCKLNHIYLCSEHHRGTFSPHGKYNEKINLELRLKLQNELEILLDKQYFNRKQIQQLLGISEKRTDMLCKMMNQRKGEFAREDILVAIMGKLVTEEEVRELNESTGSISEVG